MAIACLNTVQKAGLKSIDFKAKKVLFKKCMADGDYEQTKGIRSEQKISTGKFDKAGYLGRVYFIMDIKGDKMGFENAPKGMKAPEMKRIASRKSWIMSVKR